jgi:putative transposase
MFLPTNFRPPTLPPNFWPTNYFGEPTFGCVRFIWNRMLADSQAYYEKEQKALNPLPAHYKTEYQWLKEVDSLALANAQLQLRKAFKRFFKDKNTGYPNYKSKRNSKKSYTTNLVGRNIIISDKTIRLPKLGEIRIKKHRAAHDDWKLKSVTVTQEASGKYYVSVLYEYESQVIEQNDAEKTIGLDFAMNGLYVDSEGYCAEMPHFLRKSEERLKKAQRKLSRMYVKGKEKQSNRYYRYKHRIAVLHEKVRHQRADWLHKRSRSLVDKYDYIGIEDLDMKAMANVLNIPLDIPQTEEGPGYGGAMLAMVGCGVYESVKTCAGTLVKTRATVEPDAEIAARYETQYRKFRAIYPALKDVFRSLS